MLTRSQIEAMDDPVGALDEQAFPGTTDMRTAYQVDAEIKGENCRVLRAQNAELLAALQGVVTASDCGLNEHMALQWARDAIANVGGQS